MPEKKKRKLVGKEWSDKATEILGDKKKANDISVVISAVRESEDPSAPLKALVEVIGRWGRDEEKRVLAASDPACTSDVFAKWNLWVGERAVEAMDATAGRVSSGMKDSTEKGWAMKELALASWFRLLAAHHKLLVARSPDKRTSWSEEQTRLFRRLLAAMLESGAGDGEKVARRFREFTAYADVKQQTIEGLAQIVKACSSDSDASFRTNLICLMEVIDLEEFGEEGAGPSLVLAEAISCSYDALRKPFSRLWEAVLKMKTAPPDHKKILIMMDGKVLPHLTRPLLVTDFLLDSYNMGGVLGGGASILALGGVFTLIQQHNLEYPDFFAKLYALFTPDVLHAKYRARFLHLSDIILTSSHVPEYLVAAFVKRLARMCLRAPANAILAILPFIANLLLRHTGLSKMLYGRQAASGDNSDTDATGDPYDEEEQDPAKCRAVESSLWEVVSLQSHVLPQVSAVAKSLCKKLPQMEADLGDYLELSMSDMMENEAKKKVFVNVPLTFEAPEGIKLRASKAGGGGATDLTSKYFKLA